MVEESVLPNQSLTNEIKKENPKRTRKYPVSELQNRVSRVL
ncbi:hypothetical protein QVH35_11905 [Candidatus Nitrosotenuis chungbukensis]|nr:hypothetical protein [Candidatus Nitrosotenuis chungbukensis]WKT57962.1 hypothetical protein QVH35_11905 [Candidatus Nitrosotenuis chungbukensis]